MIELLLNKLCAIPVGKIAKKKNSLKECFFCYSAILSKIHSYLLFGDFSHWHCHWWIILILLLPY